MLLVTFDGTILAANAPAGELFGCASSALIGAEFGALLAGENCGATQSLWMSPRTSETIPTSLQVRRPEGQILPCSTVGASVCLEGADDPIIWLRLLPQESAPTAFAVFDQRSYHLSKRETVRAERREVADELRQSEQLLRLLAENIEDYAIFTLDLDGRVTSWNSGAERMNGYPREEVLGRHFSILYGPEDVERGAPDAQLHVATDALRAEDEGWRVRKDGSRFWARAALTAMRSRDGKVIGLANITRDLTERRGNQGALREAEARTRLILDTALDAVMTMDEHGVITEWNVQAESMFGWRRKEATGRLLAELVIPPRYRDAHAKGLRDFLATGVGPILNRRVEIAAVSRDGREFPVELSVAPYRIGEAWFFSGFVRDITQRKQAEEALRESELELAHANRVTTVGHLAASISHEVMQPIAAAVINTEAALRFLDAQPANLDEVRPALARAIDAGHRATDIIGRIRGLIKKAPPQKDLLQINEVISEIVALTRGEATKNSVSVQTQLAESLPLVQADRVQLQQVLVNLIINAVEAMSLTEGSRELLISTGKDGSGGVRIVVLDSGPGLNPESLDRVFDAFYTTKCGGMGMGLSICRSIVEAHGGQIWASRTADRGATLQFTLPAREAALVVIPAIANGGLSLQREA